MHPFDRMMHRLRSRADGIDPEKGDKLAPTNKTHKNYNLLVSENNKTNKNYKGLYRFIHSDLDFLLAQNWGMEPGLLYNLSKRYGTAWLKQCIRKTNQIGPRYFRENEPLEPQRGRYCRSMIIKDGKPLED